MKINFCSRLWLAVGLVCSLATGTSQAQAAGFVVDHTSATLSLIPAGIVPQAAAVKILLQHASVGSNISDGLDALQADDASYDRSHFTFQARGNPGWQAKIDDFAAYVASHTIQYDAFTTKLCYIDTDANWTYYRDVMEQVESSYPDSIFVWWTMPITTSDDTDNDTRQTFNENVRTYCKANGKILFDIADIESHAPDGTPQTGTGGREIMYAPYSSDGGHLNDTGARRVASAYWVLAARLSGWEVPVELSVLTVE